MGYYLGAAAAARQAAMVRAAAEARQAYLMRKAATAAARLDAAKQAYDEGDIRVAARLYIALALRSETPAALEAKQRLEQLAEEARQKLKQIDADFVQEQGKLSPGETSGSDGPLGPEQLASRWDDLVLAMFQGYDQVADDYGGVPAVKHELRSHIAKKRREAQFAKVLNEPEAKALWDLAQQHEQRDQQCCAYWVYQDAARLMPAPSARRAQERLAEMDQDPQIKAAADACRELQECHKLYNRAKQVMRVNPDRAQEIFAEIVQRTPEDSELHRAAKEQVGERLR